MTVRVRSPEGGELGYRTVAEVREALRLGLVAPTDEVLVPGETAWRPAASLGPAPAPGRRADRRTPPLAALAVAAAAVALLTLRSGDPLLRTLGAVLAFGLASAMFFLTARAFRRPRR